jgi:NAD(P)H-hydrate epimerase
LRSHWPKASRIAILCGGGNNGGDGYCLARLAHRGGLRPLVLAATPPERLRGDAAHARQDLAATGCEVVPFHPDEAARQLENVELIVDAFLGTGVAGPLRPDAIRVVEAINAARRPVFAIDVPSGLDSDRGVALGAAVRAEATITFVGLKRGLYLADGPELSGTIWFDNLGIEAPATAEFAPEIERIGHRDLERALPSRKRHANKGDFGRVLIVGGGPGMPGAVRLATEACLRVGAGLVSAAVSPENVSVIGSGRPEVICLRGESEAIRTALQAATVLAVGPGLGKDTWAREMLETVLSADKHTVVDADALNLIAAGGFAARDNWILTPHPGEAGRLLGTDAARVQADRPAAVAALIERYGGVVVLKGAGTLIGAAGSTLGICDRGNPGMAIAGAGDVLTGAIAGILAQCREPLLSARAGVLAHALAGDALAHSGLRGMLASELAQSLRDCVNF